MCDLADVGFTWLGREEHAPGQVEVPVLFECQVCLVGILQLLIPLHELDGDVRGVEATRVTNQGIFLTILSWVIAVHLNLGWTYSQRNATQLLAVCVMTSQITRTALFVFI